MLICNHKRDGGEVDFFHPPPTHSRQQGGEAACPIRPCRLPSLLAAIPVCPQGLPMRQSRNLGGSGRTFRGRTLQGHGPAELAYCYGSICKNNIIGSSR